MADLDLAEVAKARAAIPALANARPFAGPVYVPETITAARSAAE
jgi:hypothetical protein